MPKILDGIEISKKIKKCLKRDVKKFKGNIKLVSISLGKNSSSEIYIKKQMEWCKEIGILFEKKELPRNISQEKLANFLEKLNKKSSVNGIIVGAPLPPHINFREISARISPEKDVEGVSPFNKFTTTALAAFELLKNTGVPLKGKEVVIISHSEIIGKPLSLLLLSSPLKSPTVTVCHIATKDLSSHTRRADILFTAVGKPKLIKKDMIKKGSIIIDIGTSILDGKLSGDVDFENVKKKCSFISPVPGGVGPLTVAMLMKNVIEYAKKQKGFYKYN